MEEKILAAIEKNTEVLQEILQQQRKLAAILGNNKVPESNSWPTGPSGFNKKPDVESIISAARQKILDSINTEK